MYLPYGRTRPGSTCQVLPEHWTAGSSGMLTKQASQEGEVSSKVAPPSRASIAGEDSVPDGLGQEEEEEEEGGPAWPFEVPETWAGRAFWIIGLS